MLSYIDYAIQIGNDVHESLIFNDVLYSMVNNIPLNISSSVIKFINEFTNHDYNLKSLLAMFNACKITYKRIVPSNNEYKFYAMISKKEKNCYYVISISEFQKYLKLSCHDIKYRNIMFKMQQFYIKYIEYCNSEYITEIENLKVNLLKYNILYIDFIDGKYILKLELQVTSENIITRAQKSIIKLIIHENAQEIYDLYCQICENEFTNIDKILTYLEICLQFYNNKICVSNDSFKDDDIQNHYEVPRNIVLPYPTSTVPTSIYYSPLTPPSSSAPSTPLSTSSASSSSIISLPPPLPPPNISTQPLSSAPSTPLSTPIISFPPPPPPPPPPLPPHNVLIQPPPPPPPPPPLPPLSITSSIQSIDTCSSPLPVSSSLSLDSNKKSNSSINNKNIPILTGKEKKTHLSIMSNVLGEFKKKFTGMKLKKTPPKINQPLPMITNKMADILQKRHEELQKRRAAVEQSDISDNENETDDENNFDE